MESNRLSIVLALKIKKLNDKLFNASDYGRFNRNLLRNCVLSKEKTYTFKNISNLHLTAADSWDPLDIDLTTNKKTEIEIQIIEIILNLLTNSKSLLKLIETFDSYPNKSKLLELNNLLNKLTLKLETFDSSDLKYFNKCERSDISFSFKRKQTNLLGFLFGYTLWDMGLDIYEQKDIKKAKSVIQESLESALILDDRCLLYSQTNIDSTKKQFTRILPKLQELLNNVRNKNNIFNHKDFDNEVKDLFYAGQLNKFIEPDVAATELKLILNSKGLIPE